MFFLVARQARSSDAGTRRRAAEKLGAGGRSADGGGQMPRHVALLLDLVKDADGGVRTAAYDALGRVADARALGAMAAGLKDIDKLGEPAATGVRNAAARAFQALGTEATAALVELAKDRNTRAREAAVAALGGIGGADAERALVTALQDGRSSVRQLAVQALARSAAAGSIGSLSAALDHRDPATRRSAIDALADMKGADAGRALARLTRDGDRGVREAVVHALARQGSAEAIDALRAVCGGQDRELRQLAASLLKDLRWEPATPEQRALRAIVGGNYQAAAVEGEAAVEPLTASLADRSPAVRRAVAEALGRTSHAAAVRPLLLSLQDNDPAVRQAAAGALVQIGAAATAPLACAVHEAVRAVAPDIVSRIGAPAASPLLDLLEQGESIANEGANLRRVADQEDAERADRAAHLLNRLLGQSARVLDPHALGRAARLRDIVRVREIMPASRRESVTTVVETVVDCKEMRGRAAAELERRRD
jgi:HEAT repeat protein